MTYVWCMRASKIPGVAEVLKCISDICNGKKYLFYFAVCQI